MPRSVKSGNESSSHFEALFKNAAMSIIIANNDGKISNINPYALKVFGYARKELIGKKMTMLFQIRNSGQNLQLLRTYLKNGKPGSNLNTIAVSKSGRQIPVEVSLNHYESGGKDFVVAFIINVSSRRKAEAAIAKLTDKLEQKINERTSQFRKAMQELRYANSMLENTVSYQKAIVDNAGAMIIATDEKGVIKLFNQEAALNIGYRPSELINKKTPLIFHNKNEIAQKRERLRKEIGITIENDFEVMVEMAKRSIHADEPYTYIRKDGTTFPVLLSITSIKNKNGEITGFMGIAIDISDRKKIEEELKLALVKEKELNELKSRFVSMASHEFRTPLSTILSSAYLIEKYIDTNDQPKQEVHLRRIFSSVNMLTDTLNDFLSLGKIEEGKIQVRPAHVNIREMMINAIADLKDSLKKRQIIHYDHIGNLEITIDIQLLKHVVMNLVSNASKFSPEGSDIEIKTIVQKSSLTLSVKDYGIGISKDDQKHLMERFFRGANAVNIQGTGLGLHIVSKYVDLMNGKIVCQSELEKGTEFIITFSDKK